MKLLCLLAVVKVGPLSSWQTQEKHIIDIMHSAIYDTMNFYMPMLYYIVRY